MDILYFFLPAILILGIVTSYTDIARGKIRNSHICIALAFIPVAYALIIGYYSLAGVPVRVSYLADLGLNMAIALAFGFAAWHFGVWSAADGKLFFIYSGLVPLVAYSRTYFAYFPSFVLLINTFFPVFIYYAVKSLVFTKIRVKRDFLRKLKPGMILGLLLNVFWIGWISRLVFLFMGVNIGFLGNILLMLSLVFLIRRVASLWKVSLFLSVLRVVFDYSFVLTQGFFWEFVSYSVVLMAIFLVLAFGGSFFTSTIDVRRLKPGMILSDRICLEGGIYKKMDEMEAFEMLENGTIKRSQLLEIGKTGDGLDREDIERIRKLLKDRKLGFSSIGITQTLPFAPFLFLGVLLTLIAGGNFLLLAYVFGVL